MGGAAGTAGLWILVRGDNSVEARGVKLNGLSGWELALVGAIAVHVVGLLFYALTKLDADDPSIEQGREQVRAAERGLEGALSGRATHGKTGEGTASSEDDARALTLAHLWSLTHLRLELYHKIATGQAKRSFMSAQIAMAIGFLLLIAFVGVAFNASTTAGSVVVGGLGAVSAALAGFVSRTFVKSQETAAEHLKAYFDQPLEFSRYLAAERLVADAGLSEEQRADVMAALAQAIVAGPGAGAPANTAESDQLD